MPTINLSTELPNYLGKNIKEICENSLIDNSLNHCAHFVSHAMQYTFGFRCKGLTGKGAGAGASIRVNEIFCHCPSVGLWTNKPYGNCLAFITTSDNVALANRFMGTRPKKHIGIFCDGLIYHYSNTKDEVVAQAPEIFSKHYQGSTVTMYFGTFPTSN